MDGNKPKIFLISILLCVMAHSAQAAVIELTAMASYSKSTFADGLSGYNSTEHRYSGSVEFKFTSVSGIEFQYMDSQSNVSYQTDIGANGVSSYTPIHIDYDDKIYSVNWVQNLVPSRWMIQPYFKVGAGRLVRKYTEIYPVSGVGEVIQQNTLSGVGAVGIRIFLTKAFAIKGEFETYLPDFRIALWQTNETFSAGVSWLF